MQGIILRLDDLRVRLHRYAAMCRQSCCVDADAAGAGRNPVVAGFLVELEAVADDLIEAAVVSPGLDQLLRRCAGLWRANQSGRAGPPAELAIEIARLIGEMQRLLTHALSIVPERPRLFIGHGQRHDWRAARDHLATLGVAGVEFCDESPVGRAVTSQLERVIESCEGAVLVATGELIEESGARHPRPNVLHELGLAQQRFGRELTFVLAEEEVRLPSNLDGVGVIRFRGHDIQMAFGSLTTVLIDRCVIPGPGWRMGLVRTR